MSCDNLLVLFQYKIPSNVLSDEPITHIVGGLVRGPSCCWYLYNIRYCTFRRVYVLPESILIADQSFGLAASTCSQILSLFFLHVDNYIDRFEDIAIGANRPSFRINICVNIVASFQNFCQHTAYCSCQLTFVHSCVGDKIQMCVYGVYFCILAITIKFNVQFNVCNSVIQPSNENVCTVASDLLTSQYMI